MMIIQILVNLNGLVKGKLTKGNLTYVMVVVTLGRECLLLGHPDYNYSSQPWKDSTSGKAWAEQNFSNLPWKKPQWKRMKLSSIR